MKDLDNRCMCGEPETERYVLLECMRYNREHMKWSNKWDQEMGNVNKIYGLKEYLRISDKLEKCSYGDDTELN